MNDYLDYLEHHGVKGMKWGVRRSNEGRGIRGAVARRKNRKVDKSFQKWEENNKKKQAAIDLGKKRNEARIGYETSRTKESKALYKSSNRDYKKALRKNTTYRKGAIRGEVGSDMSRKYMTTAKRMRKDPRYETDRSFRKEHDRLMNQHDVERARARRAPEVGKARSKRIANIKRGITLSVKAAVVTAGVGTGAKFANDYLKKKGSKFSIKSEDVIRYANMAKDFMKMVY